MYILAFMLSDIKLARYHNGIFVARSKQRGHAGHGGFAYETL